MSVCQFSGCRQPMVYFQLDGRKLCQKHFELLSSAKNPNSGMSGKLALADGRTYEHPDGHSAAIAVELPKDERKVVLGPSSSYRPGTKEWKLARMAEDTKEVLRMFETRETNVTGDILYAHKKTKGK